MSSVTSWVTRQFARATGRLGDQRPIGLFVSHIRNERIEAHFQRLSSESRDYVDWRFIESTTTLQQAAAGEGPLPIRRWLPERVRQAMLTGKLHDGHLDVLLVPIAFSQGQRQVWLAEYDVEYTGNWGTFFAQFANNDADLLATTVWPESLVPEWFHWKTAQNPPLPDGIERHRAFLPLMRVSDRLLRAYLRRMRDPRWAGHYEFLLPTVALIENYKLEDIGGRGPLTPKDRRGKNYSNSPHQMRLNPGTFVWRPHVPYYFHEQPELFGQRDTLYHPVKPSIPSWNEVGTPGNMKPLRTAMAAAETKMLRRYMKSAQLYLEYGCGGSTALAAKMQIPRVVSVDSSKKWVARVQRDELIAPLVEQQNYLVDWVDIGPVGEWGFPSDPAHSGSWPNYAARVWRRLGTEIPDLILVDGRFRVSCVLQSLINCADSTIILLHDFERSHYHAVLRHTEIVERVENLVALRRKSALDAREFARDCSEFLLDPA